MSCVLKINLAQQLVQKDDSRIVTGYILGDQNRFVGCKYSRVTQSQLSSRCMHLFCIWLLSHRLSSSTVRCQDHLFIAQISMECLPPMTLCWNAYGSAMVVKDQCLGPKDKSKTILFS